jgi:hypothetical protein
MCDGVHHWFKSKGENGIILVMRDEEDDASSKCAG